MGEAKRRGTFEGRMAKALATNQALEAKAAASPNMTKFVRAHGSQRLATRLIMSGLLKRA